MMWLTTRDSSERLMVENEGTRDRRRAAVVVHKYLGTAIGSLLASSYTSHPAVALRKGLAHTGSPGNINKGLVGDKRGPWIMSAGWMKAQASRHHGQMSTHKEQLRKFG
jgi:hypothetical protein